MDLGHARSELRREIPSIRKTHRTTAEHQTSIALDEQRQVFLNEPTGDRQRMFEPTAFGIGFDGEGFIAMTIGHGAFVALEPSGEVFDQMIDESRQDLVALGLDSVDRSEDRRRMITKNTSLGIDLVVVVVTDLDPVVEFERSESESPPERARHVGLIVG